MIFSVRILRCIALPVLALAAIGANTASADSDTLRVGKYDLFEIPVTNENPYSNPFDFEEIELRAVFAPPIGPPTDFYGFYDGDGNGAQEGNIWKIRFMPDQLGFWNVTYSWSDGTPGGGLVLEVSAFTEQRVPPDGPGESSSHHLCERRPFLLDGRCRVVLPVG